MRWGKDHEERAAVAQKSHDAYAAARQALSRAESAEALAHRMIEQCTTEIMELRQQVAALRSEVSAGRNVAAVEAPVSPRRIPLKRKAA